MKLSQIIDRIEEGDNRLDDFDLAKKNLESQIPARAKQGGFIVVNGPNKNDNEPYSFMIRGSDIKKNKEIYSVSWANKGGGWEIEVNSDYGELSRTEKARTLVQAAKLSANILTKMYMGDFEQI
jgi:uncharacterized membrane protein YkoI